MKADEGTSRGRSKSGRKKPEESAENSRQCISGSLGALYTIIHDDSEGLSITISITNSKRRFSEFLYKRFVIVSENTDIRCVLVEHTRRI